MQADTVKWFKKTIRLQHQDILNQIISILHSLPSRLLVLLLSKCSGYFASRGKIAPCYFAIWRQNSPYSYFAASAKIAPSLILTQTLTRGGQSSRKIYLSRSIVTYSKMPFK